MNESRRVVEDVKNGSIDERVLVTANFPSCPLAVAV